MDDTTFFENIFSVYQSNPTSLDPSWISYFKDQENLLCKDQKIEDTQHSKDLRIVELISAYRYYGYLYATINEKESLTRIGNLLAFEQFGFNYEDLSKVFFTFGLLKEKNASLKDIIDHLKKMYCSSIGFEYMGVKDKAVEEWFQNNIEHKSNKFELSTDDKQKLLEELTNAEIFETFLHTKFVGQTRFSLEGAESLLPLINSIIGEASNEGIENFQIGMSHRGRINVLVNVLKKTYNEVFHEFEDVISPKSFQTAGDVKYHKGYTSKIISSKGASVNIHLMPNPSHLESVISVAEGATKALQVKNGDKNKQKNITLLIHGDAAIAGQGVVYETLQLQKLQGYSTGGSLHVIVNNKIGFTTLPNEYMSTFFCTDIAKAFDCPVFHVDAEDVEATVLASKLALAYRNKFAKDVFINLNCYRKYGHNESDEPFFTQPQIYHLIKAKKTIAHNYLQKLIEQNNVSEKIKDELENNYKVKLQQILEDVKKGASSTNSRELFEKFEEAHNRPDYSFEAVDTSINFSLFKELVEKASHVLPGFETHKKIVTLLQHRLEVLSKSLSEKSIDWSFAETIAFASILWEGTAIRLSGEDCQRGTFSQRHSCLVDQNNEQRYIPLNHLKEGQALFEVYNSPLSEFSVLGFEYGYSLFYKDALVIWEAQYGDFSNEAQVIIDEYIMAGRDRWEKLSRLTLFLPHGFEGQGPEHSSAKIERFLQLGNKNNVNIVIPTTPAQLFHLLRRQVLKSQVVPLIVFTPKGLLRDPKCLSSIDEFTSGTFKEILDDEQRPYNPKKLLICSGRIYFDLISERVKRDKSESIAIIRVEQLYPLNLEILKDLIVSYKEVDNICWIQEEPKNMGAWNYIKGFLQEIVKDEKKLHLIARKAKATPAVGSYRVHQFEYEILMKQAFEE